MNTCLMSILTFMMIGLAQGQSERSLIREGNRLYKDNKFADAEVNYRKAVEKNKEFREGPFNLGDALYKQGRFGEAAEQYQLAVTRTKDVAEKAQSYHNLGNALLKSQKIPESIAAYKEALKLHPNDLDTKYNLEYAKQLLKQQQQQQNKNQKNDDKQKKEQNKQDQQKQDQQKQDQQKQDQQKSDQQQREQQQAEQKDQQQKQVQQKKQQISKQDAERILEALKNEEKDVQKKLHKKVPARVRVEKDW